MTYCLAIKVNDGIVFASDSRTNAGVDQVNTYSKMHVFGLGGERFFVLLSAGNLATTQAVVNTLQRDLEYPDAESSLDTVDYMFDAAHYVGMVSRRIQEQYRNEGGNEGFNPEASFILGGQIGQRDPDIHLIYPEGNYIGASPANPFLQIGETKYGKPILDRIITPKTSLEDAARCALLSLDSTARSNISVGPPYEVGFYHSGELTLRHRMSLDPDSKYYVELQKRWADGLKRIFADMPLFYWER